MLRCGRRAQACYKKLLWERTLDHLRPIDAVEAQQRTHAGLAEVRELVEEVLRGQQGFGREVAAGQVEGFSTPAPQPIHSAEELQRQLAAETARHRREMDALIQRGGGLADAGGALAAQPSSAHAEAAEGSMAGAMAAMGAAGTAAPASAAAPVGSASGSAGGAALASAAAAAAPSGSGVHDAGALALASASAPASGGLGLGAGSVQAAADGAATLPQALLQAAAAVAPVADGAAGMALAAFASPPRASAQPGSAHTPPIDTPEFNRYISQALAGTTMVVPRAAGSVAPAPAEQLPAPAPHARQGPSRALLPTYNAHSLQDIEGAVQRGMTAALRQHCGHGAGHQQAGAAQGSVAAQGLAAALPAAPAAGGQAGTAGGSQAGAAAPAGRPTRVSEDGLPTMADIGSYAALWKLYKEPANGRPALEAVDREAAANKVKLEPKSRWSTLRAVVRELRSALWRREGSGVVASLWERRTLRTCLTPA